MELLDVIVACGTRVCGGTEYQRNCYGSNARFMEFADVAGSEYCSVVHDALTYEIYQVEVHVPGQEQAFKWHNPAYREAFVKEAAERKVQPDIAWDELSYQLVDESTILQYAKDVGAMYYDDLPIPENA